MTFDLRNIAILMTFFVVLPFSASAQKLETEAATIVELRDKVDALSRAVEDRKNSDATRLRSLNAQAADLEIQIQREEAQLKSMNAALERRKEEVSAANKDAANFGPTLQEAIEKIKLSVAEGIPFKKGKRLADLKKLESALASKTLPEVRGLSRVWQFIEDEIRLSKENGLYKQTIDFEGEEVLCEVVRIGMVALYFRTEEGVTGHAVSTSKGWEFQRFTEEADQLKTAQLFDAFRKQIRAGGFDLPGTLWIQNRGVAQ